MNQCFFFLRNNADFADTAQLPKKTNERTNKNSVLHDGAPNMGAAWAQDAYTQSELCLYALKLAAEFLAPEGVFSFWIVFVCNDFCFSLSHNRHFHYKDFPFARLQCILLGLHAAVQEGRSNETGCVSWCLCRNLHRLSGSQTNQNNKQTNVFFLHFNNW